MRRKSHFLFLVFLEYLLYFKEGRQDKKDNSRAAISSKAVIDCFKVNGMSRMVCLDLHAAAIQGFFDGPADNLYATKMIVQHLKENVFEEGKEYIVAAPDLGAAKRATYLAETLGLPLIQMNKSRDPKKKNTVDEIVITGDVNEIQGKYVLLPDDMCDTAGTVVKAAERLHQAGAEGVIVVVTHGILSSPATERLNSCKYITRFICSDSIPLDKKMEECSKITTFSIAPLLADVIDCLLHRKSISRLFE